MIIRGKMRVNEECKDTMLMISPIWGLITTGDSSATEVVAAAEAKHFPFQ